MLLANSESNSMDVKNYSKIYNVALDVSLTSKLSYSVVVSKRVTEHPSLMERFLVKL